MKEQGAATHRGGWVILADFAQTLAVSLAAGVLFSLLSVLLVFIVSTVE
jgi:hypothetical protein